MNTQREIVSKYMVKPEYRLNNCLAFYRELHDNGHLDPVMNFLAHGDSVLGQQGYTWEAALSQLAQCQSSPFNDHRGEYAGSHKEYYYNGQKVYSETSYSLFN